MPDGLPDPGKIWNDFITNPLVQTAGTLIVIYVVLLWLGTAYWAFRDMQARSENPILPYFASALIIFFTPLLFLFAVVLYLIVRPRESLAEVYERPNCRTRLHRVCPSCSRLADPEWPLCAYCGHEFQRPAARPAERVMERTAPARPAERSPDLGAEPGLRPASNP